MVEVYAAVRQFVFNDGKSRREAARVFGLSRETVSKMCRFSMPPGYVRQRPAEKPKLGPLIPVIEAILEAALRGDPQPQPAGRSHSIPGIARKSGSTSWRSRALILAVIGRGMFTTNPEVSVLKILRIVFGRKALFPFAL